MLTYLDKQKFEEIRAKWEAAQPKKQQQTGKMPGRKERLSEAYQPLDINNDGRNRKLRRFSSITSFISTPNSFMTKAFSRRKQPARSSAANTSMTTLMNVSEAERREVRPRATFRSQLKTALLLEPHQSHNPAPLPVCLVVESRHQFTILTS